MFLLNSRPALFSATPESYTRKGLHPPGRPISRSYGALLSSSLAEVRPNALGRLSQPTSGGLRYGRQLSHSTRGFSCRHGLNRVPNPKVRFPSTLSS